MMSAAYLKTPSERTVHALAPYWCAGKEAFATPALAAEVARRSVIKGRRSHYRCSFCGMWHVGGGRIHDRTRKVHGMNLVRSEIAAS